MFLEAERRTVSLTGHIQREVGRRQDVVVAAPGDLVAGIGGLGAVLARQAGQILGHIEIGVDERAPTLPLYFMPPSSPLKLACT
jgi:hypothetical protein